MAANTKRNDSTPVDGTLSAFIKEAKESEVTPYLFDVGKGKRITFKSPDDIGTQEFVTIVGGGLEGMSDQGAIKFFLDATLSDEDRETFLNANPPLRVTLLIMDDVRKHYEAQVASSGESSASSD